MFDQTYFKAEEVDTAVHCSCSTFHNEKALCQLYQHEFQPITYIANNYTRFDGEVEFCLRNLHRFFTREVEPGIENGLETRRVLEIGAGPVPIHMLSASRWTNWIVFSDYLEINRKKLLEWVERQSSAVDERWLTSAQYVSRLEYEDPLCTPHDIIKQHRCQTGLSLLQRLRQSVRAVIPCDVMEQNILLEETGDQKMPTFDVVLSAFCFERVAPSFSDYKEVVAKVARLLNPSGYLVIMGELGGLVFHINEVPVPTLKLTAGMVNEAINETGCLSLVDWIEYPRRQHSPQYPADFSEVFFCVARRVTTTLS